MIARLAQIHLVALVLALSACTTLQRDPVKVSSRALAPADGGLLAEVSRNAQSRLGAGQSAFHLIPEAEAALNWRLALIDHATESIDIQYYLWEDDEAGQLLLARLIEAARRGVRVRILVDDFLYKGDEKNLATVCHHPNFDIRIFNPNLVRSGTIAKLLEYVVDFPERNRRMHNKMFVVDGRVAIMGGRNIGNHYFGLSDSYNFLDLDVMTAGAIVPKISAAFDEFWNSDPAYPGTEMSMRERPDRAEQAFDAFLAKFRADPGILPRTDFPLERRDWSAEWRALATQWRPGRAIVVQDEPVVAAGKERRRFLESAPKLTDPEDPRGLVLVTPYLIPGEGMYEALADYDARDVPVTFIVPGLDSNNQSLVHSHYKKHRRQLLENGVALHELRPDPDPPLSDFATTEPARNESVALHLKSAVGDGRRAFIGSLNLDPRSIEINTENGLYIDSPELAADVLDYFRLIAHPDNAWQVTSDGPDGTGTLRWRSRDEELTRQPAPGTGKRISDFIFGLLPIEGQL